MKNNPFFVIKKGLVSQKLDNNTVIFDSKKSVLYTFNETASLIFKMIKQQKTIEEICKKIVTVYAVTDQQATKDIKKLINELQKKHIIVQTET